jgi:hypothetical protein
MNIIGAVFRVDAGGRFLKNYNDFLKNKLNEKTYVSRG